MGNKSGNGLFLLPFCFYFLDFRLVTVRNSPTFERLFMEFGSAAFFRRGLYVCITFIGGVRILVQLDIFHAAGDGRMSDTDELKVVAHLSVDIFRVTASALSAFAELITRRALIAAGSFSLV